MSRLIQSAGERTIMEPPGGQPPLVTNPYGPAAYTPLSAWQHNMAGFSAYGPPVWPNIEPASDVVEDSRVDPGAQAQQAEGAGGTEVRKRPGVEFLYNGKTMDYKALTKLCKEEGITGAGKSGQSLLQRLVLKDELVSTFTRADHYLSIFKTDDHDDFLAGNKAAYLKDYLHQIEFTFEDFKADTTKRSTYLNLICHIKNCFVIQGKLDSLQWDLQTNTGRLNAFDSLVKIMLDDSGDVAIYQDDKFCFEELLKVVPLKIGSEAVSKIKANDNTYARMAAVMEDPGLIRYTSAIGQGCADRNTRRQELDAEGKKMMDSCWQALTDAYNDPGNVYATFTIQEGAGHGVLSSDIKHIDPNHGYCSLTADEFKKCWAHAK